MTIATTILDAARRRPAVTASAVTIGLALVAMAAYLFQPWLLFVDEVVDESFPTIAAPAAGQDAGTANADADDMAVTDGTSMADATDATDGSDAAPTEAGVDGTTDEAAPATGAGADADAQPAQAAEPTGPLALVTGEFISRSHGTSGTATIYRLEDGTRTLRLENLATDNGPDLFVYLSTANADAPEGAFDDQFVNLGRLKGNVGNQNYEIPADVGLADYASVVIWCDRFDVAFGAADLA